jgi:hypothetical protein
MNIICLLTVSLFIASRSVSRMQVKLYRSIINNGDQFNGKSGMVYEKGSTGDGCYGNCKMRIMRQRKRFPLEGKPQSA